MRIKYTKEFLENAVKQCVSFRQLLLLLGLKEAGGNYANLKKKCEEYEIDTSHFIGQNWNRFEHPLFEKQLDVEKTFCLHEKRRPSSKTKQLILNHKLKEYRCEICGISEWLGKKIILQLHHKNGNPKDDRLENLQILCPNCHSQTDSFCKR